MMLSPTHGLGWNRGMLGEDETPIWTDEPDVNVIEQLSRLYLSIAVGERCSVAFLAEGSRNKVYTLETDHRTYVMRVGLPLDPIKVANEAATMAFVRDQVSTPSSKMIRQCRTDPARLRSLSQRSTPSMQATTIPYNSHGC